MTFSRDICQRFVSMFHLCVCLDLLRILSLYWLMLLNATLWNTVTHAFQGNGLKLADWSKRVCITLWSCFCSLMTSNWEVSSSRLHYSFIKFTQIAKTFVISWYIDDIETNLPIGRHAFVCLMMFWRIVRKIFLDASCFCLSRFVAFFVAFLIYAVERTVVVYCHAYN